MTKKEVIDAMVRLIQKIAYNKGVQVVDKGCGHAFDYSFWKGILTDDSGIPSIMASDNDLSIELRSVWGYPELLVRRNAEKCEDLLTIRYSDFEIVGEEYVHTGDYKVREIRINGYNNYKSCINEICKMIEEIEKDVL